MLFPICSLLKLNCTYSFHMGPLPLCLHVTISTFLYWTYMPPSQPIPPSLHTKSHHHCPHGTSNSISTLFPTPSFIFHHCSVVKAAWEGVCPAAGLLPLLLRASFPVISTSQSTYRGCSHEKTSRPPCLPLPSEPDKESTSNSFESRAEQVIKCRWCSIILWLPLTVSQKEWQHLHPCCWWVTSPYLK